MDVAQQIKSEAQGNRVLMPAPEFKCSNVVSTHCIASFHRTKLFSNFLPDIIANIYARAGEIVATLLALAIIIDVRMHCNIHVGPTT